jgi:hypothetical protein
MDSGTFVEGGSVFMSPGDQFVVSPDRSAGILTFSSARATKAKREAVDVA